MTTLRRASPVDLVIDTSAIMAVVLAEQLADALASALRSAQGAVISVATAVELAIVARARLGDAGAEGVQTLLDAARVVAVPVDLAIAAGATDAWRRFGRGRHPAGLNFGDCFSYATAKHYDAPLLCVGSDFARTDLEVVVLRKPTRRR